jgi:hypothetical protein
MRDGGEPYGVRERTKKRSARGAFFARPHKVACGKIMIAESDRDENGRPLKRLGRIVR